MKIKLLFCFFLIILMVDSHAQQFSWATPVSGNQYEYGTKCIKDALGNNYFIGYTTGSTFKFNGNTYVANGDGDAFFVKLDANKELLWIKSVGGDDPIYYDWASDIHIDPFGDIYLTFKSSGNNFTYNGQVLDGINSPGQYSGEAVLLKVDADGNYIWHDSGTVQSSFTGITTDLNGNVYITGSFNRLITLGGSITLTNLSTDTTQDFLVAKYDRNGTILWAKNAGGLPLNTFAYGFDIEINPQTNELIVLGRGEGAVYFDGVPMPTTGGSNKAILLISYTQEGTQNWVKEILYVPNSPFSRGTSLDISGSGVMGVCGQTFTNGLVGFYNSNGSVISEQMYPSTSELRVYSITFNEYNDAYLSGWCTGGTLGISPGTVTIASTTGFIAKVDIFQQVKWVENFYSSISSNRINYQYGIITFAGRIDAPFTYNSGQNVIINQLGDALFGEVIDHELSLSVTSFQPEDIIVSPNPTSGLVDIKANDFQRVDMYHIDGRLLESGATQQLNLSQHPSGLYFLKIITDHGSAVKKILLQ